MASKPSISVSTVQKIPSKTNSTKKETDGITTHFETKTFYITDNGTIQIPLASDDRSESKIVKTSAKFTKKIVMWEAEKIGGIPDIPSPSENSNEFLDETVIGTVTPMFMPDGITKVYTLTGKYVYNLKKPVDENRDIEIPSNPIDKLSRSTKITSKNYLT